MSGCPNVAGRMIFAVQSAASASGVRVGVGLPVHLVSDQTKGRVGMFRSVGHATSVFGWPVSSPRLDSAVTGRGEDWQNSREWGEHVAHHPALRPVGAIRDATDVDIVLVVVATNRTLAIKVTGDISNNNLTNIFLSHFFCRPIRRARIGQGRH
jgi:hypothetical protein